MQIAVLNNDLPRVQADAQLSDGILLDLIASGYCTLKLLCADHCTTDRSKSGHEAISGVFHNDAAMLAHLLERPLCDLPFDRRGSFVAQPLVEKC